MSFDNIQQFPSDEDGCDYFYDEKRKTWKKVCDIVSPSDLPLDVRQQVREAQIEAESILNLPL
jgi:hypothetical protein